jgi:hypothetical protein
MTRPNRSAWQSLTHRRVINNPETHETCGSGAHIFTVRLDRRRADETLASRIFTYLNEREIRSINRPLLTHSTRGIVYVYFSIT